MNAKKWIKVFSILVLSVMLLAACKPAESKEAGEGVPHPSNVGGNSEAINLTGDSAKGKEVFDTNCTACHGQDGKGNVANPNSTDGTVPALNPVDAGLMNSDAKVFASNLDLFLNNGSTPEGSSPALKMPAFGKDKTLTSQQIADVIAYVVSLNKK
jgi:mono/diheme cytochrome c family protein